MSFSRKRAPQQISKTYRRAALTMGSKGLQIWIKVILRLAKEIREMRDFE